MTRAIKSWDGTSCDGKYYGSWCADCVCDLKAAQKVQNSLIQEIKFNKFKSGHNAVEVGHHTVTRWSKKFCSGCLNLNDQMRSGELKPLIPRLCSKPNLVNNTFSWHLRRMSLGTRQLPLFNHYYMLHACDLE